MADEVAVMSKWHPPPGTFRIYRSPVGQWVGIASVQTARGPVYVVAKADERVIRSVLMRGGAVSGWSLKKAWRRVKKAAKSVVRDTAKIAVNPAKTAAKMAVKLAKGDVQAALQEGVKGALRQNPLSYSKLGRSIQQKVLQAAPLVAPFIPGGAAALPFVKAASSMLLRAQQGDPVAQASIRRLRWAAATNANAARASNALLALAKGAAAGDWMTAQGPLWDTLRPHFSYSANPPITTRRAYRQGINVLATL